MFLKDQKEKICFCFHDKNTVRPDFGKIWFWQQIFKAQAIPTAYIMLMGSVYGNPGFSETPNLANNFYARIA